MIQAGTALDRYTVLGPLGRGGMASVYRVRHGRLGTTHALKVLHGGSPSLRERLLREGRVQGNLRHTNIVAVTDVIDVDGAPGLVMEYVEGPTLGQLLDAGRLTPTQADALARPILDGVVAAHRAGLVHRDLKPANVLLALEDERIVPKIADFGLAKVLVDADPEAHKTRSGVAMGTPAYMAPEQIRDASRVDGRADVFALGCILYELVSGRTAFRGTDSFELLQAVCTGRFEDVRSVVPGLDPALVDAIHGALVTDPDQRIGSAEALRAAWIADRPAPAADSALLARCRTLVEDPPAEVGSAETWTGSLAVAETLEPGGSLATEPATDEVSAPPPVKESAGSWVPWAGLAGLVVVCMAAVGWLAGEPGPPPPPERPEPAGPEVLGLGPVPQLLDDPGSQDALEAGWAAFLDADFPAAERKLEDAVRDDPPDPLVWALLAESRLIQGDVGDGVQAIWTAFSKAEEDDGPWSELLPAMAAIATAEGWEGQGAATYRAHLDAYPQDYLAAIAPLVSQANHPPPDRVARDSYAAGTAVDRPPPVAHVLFASDRLMRGHWTEAEQTADAGLGHSPSHPQLLDLRGRARMHQGDFEAARGDLLAAIQRDAALTDSRIQLAQVALVLGEESLLGELEAQLLGATTPPTDQARYATTTAGTLAGLGRADEAFALLTRVETRAREANAWPALGELLLARYDLQSALDQEGALPATLSALRQVLQAPELAPDLRQRWSEAALVLEASLAARDGDLERARAVRKRLESVPRPNPANLARVDHELAVATANVDGLDPDVHPDRCAGHAALALDRHRAGDPGAGDALRALATDPTCSALGLDQILKDRAERALRQGRQ